MNSSSTSRRGRRRYKTDRTVAAFCTAGVHAGILVLFALIATCAGAENAYLQKALEQKFGGSGNSIAVVDVHTGNLIAAVNPDAIYLRKNPPGSLIKIFTVMAYAADHGTLFPEFHCPSTSARDPEGCWDRNGHGNVGLEKAIAFSCNVYFRQLAKRTSMDSFSDVLQYFGIISSRNEVISLPEPTQRKLMVGNTLEWSATPILILRAYCALYNGGRLWQQGGNPAREVVLPPAALLERIRSGMRAGGESGTSLLAHRESGVSLLGKTGTSLQSDGAGVNWNHTQGWWLGLYPVDHPAIAILTFAREGRGATDAAPLGGKALAEYLKLTHAQ